MSHYKPYPAYKDSGVEWLGQVPEHWDILPLKRDLAFLTSGSRGWAEHYADDGAIFLRIGNLPRDGLELDLSDTQFVDIPDGAEGERTKVCAGDVLFSITAYLGSVAIVPDGLPDAYVSQHVALARLKKTRLRPRWAGYIALSWVGKTYLESQGYGGTKVQLSLEDIANMLMTVPPCLEQEHAEKYLDRETARIDVLVAKKTRFTELLREKRQALITHAVTKGLDPNVKMKDSGVEWLGQVPEHWETMSLARVTVARCDGPFGSAIKSENYTDSGVRVIRLQNIGIGEFKDGDQAFLSPEYRTEVIGHSHDVEPGDLLIAGLGDENNPLGRTCVAPSSLGDAIVKADCYRFRTDRSRALPAFLALQLSATARVECGFISTGSTRERLNLGLAASRVIALPPSTDEQSAIVERASMATARLDALLSKTERSIELLKERRAALITAAVTGRIDVRESA